MQITSEIVERFRNSYGGTFADISKWSEDMVYDALCQADSETGGSGWHQYGEDCHNLKWRGMRMFAAHYLTAFWGDRGLTPKGIASQARLNTASKSVGDESISYRVASMMDAGNDFLTYTVFGQEFYRLRKRVGMGARTLTIR